MKKVFTGETARYLTRKRQDAAQRDADRERDRHQRFSTREIERRVRQSNLAAGARDPRRRITISPPGNFSFLTNTDRMLEMIDDMTAHARKGQTLYLEMKDVESITPEAIAVLDAVVDRLVARYHIPISGSEPESTQMAAIVRRSGFYKHVRPPATVDTSLEPDKGIIAHEQNCIVDGALSQQLIHFATERLTGQQQEHHSIYAALGELMQNTFDHAQGAMEPGNERWWASVYYDEHDQVAHFTFFDTGVGIFGSREVSSVRDRVRAMFSSDPEFLKNIFEGKIASRTGVPWRGQGLPRLYRRVQRGELRDMMVITNGVKGYLDSGQFTALSREFKGTLYHWELRNDGKSNH